MFEALSTIQMVCAVLGFLSIILGVILNILKKEIGAMCCWTFTALCGALIVLV